jgi:hypothetical protein
MKSIFLNKEGASLKNRILDFLIVYQEFDYSLKDIAKFSKVSYSSMKTLKNELIRDKWIVLTRTVGKAQMYKLNLNNKKVSTFVDFYWSVIESETGDAKPSNYASSGRAAIPVSAKNL